MIVLSVSHDLIFSFYVINDCDHDSEFVLVLLRELLSPLPFYKETFGIEMNDIYEDHSA